MVKLDLGVKHNTPEWDRCTGQGDCVDPKPNDWTKSSVMTVTSASFAKKAPDAYTYLTKRSWSNGVVNSLLAYMDNNQAGGEDGAEEFLKKHEAIWSKWVPASVAKKVKAALLAS